MFCLRRERVSGNGRKGTEMKINKDAAYIRTYEFKVDENTGEPFVEIREEDGCKYVDNISPKMTEEEKAKYIAGLEKDGYVSVERAAEIEAQKKAEMPPVI